MQQPAPPGNTGIDQDFNLPPRYKFVRILGKGAYGIVGQFRDTAKNEDVAVKRIPLGTTYQDEAQRVAEAKKIYRELRILHNFRHDNLIGIKHAIVSQEGPTFYIYMFTRLMDADLQRVIVKSALTDDHVQYIMYQIFRGLNFLHKGNVIHRDIKPNNILATEECEIVLCDLGFAREMETFNQMMTEYVYTRVYRAPEIVLHPKHYTEEIDIWAVGCTFYELMTKRNLFKAKDYKDLIAQIVGLLGRPTHDDIAFIESEGAKKFVLGLEGGPPGGLDRKLQGYSNPLAVDLLKRCLSFNPAKRCTAEEAMRHPYFKNYFDPAHLNVVPPVVDFSFETAQKITSVEVYRMIMNEIKLINNFAGENYPIPNF